MSNVDFSAIFQLKPNASHDKLREAAAGRPHHESVLNIVDCK